MRNNAKIFFGTKRKMPEMLVIWFLPAAKPSGARTVRVLLLLVVVVVGGGD